MADKDRDSDAADRDANSISPSKKHGQARKEQATASQPARNDAAKPTRPVPDEVRRRFVQVKNRYYFPDGARAFTDRGTRLTTSSENTEVIRSLILIAEARGWREVAVRGTERFRREAWLAGHLAGVEVRGYKPTEFERSQLVRTLHRKDPATGPQDGVKLAEEPRAPGSLSPGAEGRAREIGDLLTGRLIEHGPATYRHDPHEPMSYFAKIETPRGERTIWGVDIERAFKESLSKPGIGDEVRLRAVRQEAVKVRTQRRDAQGKLTDRELATHRNRWIVERRDFVEARAKAARTVRDTSIDPKQAVQTHPELVGTYLQLHAAELAAKRFRDPQDRERFVQHVRSALADSVARGEPLPAVRLRERLATRAPQTPQRESVLTRG